MHRLVLWLGFKQCHYACHGAVQELYWLCKVLAVEVVIGEIMNVLHEQMNPKLISNADNRD